MKIGLNVFARRKSATKNKAPKPVRQWVPFKPDCSYDHALVLTNDNTLLDRRDSLCRKFMTEMVESREHPLAFLVQLPMLETIPYNLRSGATQPTKPLKRTKRSQDFFTTKYHV